MSTRYRKRKCTRCGAPVNQRIEDALANQEPLCPEHGREQSVRKMHAGFSALRAEIARQTIDFLRARGVVIPNDIAEQALAQARVQGRQDAEQVVAVFGQQHEGKRS